MLRPTAEGPREPDVTPGGGSRPVYQRTVKKARRAHQRSLRILSRLFNNETENEVECGETLSRPRAGERGLARERRARLVGGWVQYGALMVKCQIVLTEGSGSRPECGATALSPDETGDGGGCQTKRGSRSGEK